MPSLTMRTRTLATHVRIARTHFTSVVLYARCPASVLLNFDNKFSLDAKSIGEKSAIHLASNFTSNSPMTDIRSLIFNGFE